MTVELDTAHPSFFRFILCASVLRRQAAFATMAALTREGPEMLAERLRPLAPTGSPFQQIAHALMGTRRVREIVRAVSGRVPDGLLGVMSRLGDDPLPDPDLYFVLGDLFCRPENRLRARALMQSSGTICAKQIEIVRVLDPVLLHRNVLKRLFSVEQAERFNAALALVRATVSTATDASIRLSVEHMGPKTDFGDLITRWLNKMDTPPFVPPIPPDDPDFRALTKGHNLISLGRRYRNCLGERVPYLATGAHAYLEWRHGTGAIAECRRTTDGRLVLVEVHSPGNGRTPTALAAGIRRGLEAHGISALSQGEGCRDVRGVLSLLGVWDFGGELGFDHEADFEKGLSELERELREAADAD